MMAAAARPTRTGGSDDATEIADWVEANFAAHDRRRHDRLRPDRDALTTSSHTEP